MAFINFETKNNFSSTLYTGNTPGQSITGVGFRTDFTWFKGRVGGGYDHSLRDILRGTLKHISTDASSAESDAANSVSSFDADGFTLGTDNRSFVNENNTPYVSWSWLAGGTAPSNTYVVKVVSDGGNKYRFDDFGTSAVTLEISEGGTFTFDQADSSNSGHPLRFSTTANGTHGGGSEYTTGVTTNGTPGNAGAYTRITVAASAPTLYYYCTYHSGMGGQANTPTTNSFSNFSGSIQSNISVNTTSGVSIIKYVGNGSAGATVGHGLGKTATCFITKRTSGSSSWGMYHQSTGAGGFMELNSSNALQSNSAYFNNTAPTSSVFSIGTDAINNTNGSTYICYCFTDTQGFMKFGKYLGNSNDGDGTFTYLGFKPQMVIIKCSDTDGEHYHMHDTKIQPGNLDTGTYLLANTADAENTSTSYAVDLLSNGFKARTANNSTNGTAGGSGRSYIYLAYAEDPFTTSTAIPGLAR